ARVPVADYVSAEDAEWLQTNRVELNAMRPRDFVAWLSGKMDPYHAKVIPPQVVIQARLQEELRQRRADDLREQILKEAGFERRLEGVLKRGAPEVASRAPALGAEIKKALAVQPKQSWADVVGNEASQIAARQPTSTSPSSPAGTP